MKGRTGHRHGFRPRNYSGTTVSVACRRRQRRRTLSCWHAILRSSMIVLLSAWRFQQGISFAPITTKVFVPRQNKAALTSLRDTEDPIVVKEMRSSSTVSSASTALNATHSSRTNKAANVSLRMPKVERSRNNPLESDSKNDKDNKVDIKYFVPAEDLAKLTESIDIVSLIECYGIPHFSKTADGTRASCLCPFHDDHNPSLKIDGQRGIFKCFSCGVGGNALSFVREYAKLHGTEISFLEAVKLLDDMVVTAAASGPNAKPVLPVGVTVPMGARPPAHNVTISKADGTVKKKLPTKEASTTSRQRVLLANLHAAAYYEQCLLSRLDAGAARAHLRSRGIKPTTVKAFAIGFAPETYFTAEQTTPLAPAKAWGEGSLVHYMRDRGFSPQEIIDAGLAIRTRRGKQQLEQMQKRDNNDDNTTINATSILDNDFSTLMDRFRGRLVVPIFDATGSHILGFGGRILESVTSGLDFKAAKYLNSPESIVFQKKEVLFGQHMAEKSFSRSNESIGPRSIVVVEGYMDAIAMWQAGIRETVASMGTALSLEQLQTAASSARKVGAGKLVLCLDNDDAGVAAVERLCSGQKPILLFATESSNVEVCVAELPEEVKDPAEYLERNWETEGLDRKFRSEVIQDAVEWTDWYIGRLLLSFDASAIDGDEGSFSRTFESLASFLSVFEDADKQTKTASIMAKKLAPLLRKDGHDDEESRSMTRSQLESNLLQKASIISRSYSLRAQGNIELSESSLFSSESRQSGIVVSRNLEISQDLAKYHGPQRPKASESRPPGFEFVDEPANPKPRSSRRFRMKRPKRLQKELKAMTPHIGGMKPHSMDAAWLRASSDKSAGDRNHFRYEIMVEGSRMGKFKNFIGPETSVRFNHNQYHGTWSSTAASMAGYSSRVIPRNLDFLERGTSSLLEVNKEDIAAVAEDLMLRLLLRSADARRSLSKSLRVDKASGSSACKIHWSQPEKEWLFNCLVGNPEEIPNEGAGVDGPVALRQYLIDRPDCFPGALGRLKLVGTVETLRSNPDEGLRFDSDAIEETPAGNSFADADVIEASPAEKANHVPSIGDHWSDFMEMEGYYPNSETAGLPSLAITDEYLDSMALDGIGEDSEVKDAKTTVKALEGNVITPGGLDDSSALETPGTLDADYVATDITSDEGLAVEGSLDYLFRNNNNNINDIDLFSQDAFDEMLTERGDHSSKATWAAEDLHTILQTTSVLHRVQAARDYLLEEQTSELVDAEGIQRYRSAKRIGGTTDSKAMTRHIMNETELAEYCSPHCPDGGLLHDLHLARTLQKSNQRARKRIHSQVLAGFTDEKSILRGYSWLNHVLRFNELKMSQWSDIVESKSGFQLSDERLEVLKKIVVSDWNELSELDEMWDWNRNVNLDHTSRIAQVIMGDENPESAEDVSERIEEEWGWLVEEVDEDIDVVDDQVNEKYDDDYMESQYIEEEDGFDSAFDDGVVEAHDLAFEGGEELDLDHDEGFAEDQDVEIEEYGQT